jgi:hypothetical protein
MNFWQVQNVPLCSCPIIAIIRHEIKIASKTILHDQRSSQCKVYKFIEICVSSCRTSNISLVFEDEYLGLVLTEYERYQTKLWHACAEETPTIIKFRWLRFRRKSGDGSAGSICYDASWEFMDNPRDVAIVISRDEHLVRVYQKHFKSRMARALVGDSIFK